MEPPHIPTSPETMTESWLQRVLAKEFGIRAVPNAKLPTITEMRVIPGAILTDGFMSRLERIVVKARKYDSSSSGGGNATDSDSDEREFRLVAKLYPPGAFHRKLVSKTRVFEREIHVYSVFSKLVLQHQTESSLSSVMKAKASSEPYADVIKADGKMHLPLPKIFFHEVGLDASCIVMEDLKECGFRLNDKRVGMSFEHARLCVVAEAVFNALGINAKKRMGVEDYIMTNAPLVLETLTGGFIGMMDHQIFPGIIAFAKGQNRMDLAEKLESYVKKSGGSVYQRFKAGFSRRGDLATFSHGDCWNNNFMFRFEKDPNGREVPVEVKIVDLQLSRYCHPSVDLAAFLLCNLESSVRDAHAEGLISLYYDTMASILDNLATPGWSRENYTADQFKSDVDDAWEYGFLTACWLLPLILAEEDERTNFFEGDGEKRVEEAFDGYEEKMAKGVNADVVRRCIEVLEFGVRKGII